MKGGISKCPRCLTRYTMDGLICGECGRLSGEVGFTLEAEPPPAGFPEKVGEVSPRYQEISIARADEIIQNTIRLCGGNQTEALAVLFRCMLDLARCAGTPETPRAERDRVAARGLRVLMTSLEHAIAELEGS